MAAYADFGPLGEYFAVLQHEKLFWTEGYANAAAFAVFFANDVEITFFLFSHTLLTDLVHRSRSVQTGIEILESMLEACIGMRHMTHSILKTRFCQNELP